MSRDLDVNKGLDMSRGLDMDKRVGMNKGVGVGARKSLNMDGGARREPTRARVEPAPRQGTGGRGARSGDDGGHRTTSLRSGGPHLFGPPVACAVRLLGVEGRSVKRV